MDQRQRTGLAAGLALILIGAALLIVRLVPSLRAYGFPWPLTIVGVGVFLAVLGVATRTPGLAIPACIVGGIGGLLYWQALTDNWESWSYAWALIPGFVGVGMVVAGLLERPEKRGELLRGGVTTIVISLILFAIFGAFLGGLFGLGEYWPLLLVALGVALLVEAFVVRKR
jgi:hypothetical protein